MGCILSKCARNTAKLERLSPARTAAEIAGPENKGREFTDRRHRYAHIIVYRRQITGNALEDRALNLGPVRDQTSEEGLLRSTAGSFSEPAADSTIARGGLRQIDRRPADLGDTSSVDVLPVRDHEMLWKILSARPGWEREVFERGPGITEGFVLYRSRLLQTIKRLQLPSACCLPWPELYEASKDLLSSLVEMVNKCTGSEIFELRIVNDGQQGFKTKSRIATRIATMPPPPPENGTNRYGSQADERLRATTEGGRRGTIATSMFRNSSHTVQDVDLGSVERTSTSDHIPMGAEMQRILLQPSQRRKRRRGPIATATGEEPAVRNSEDAGPSNLASRPTLF